MLTSHQFKVIVDNAYQVFDALPIANSSNIYKEIRKLAMGTLDELQEQIISWKKDLLAKYIYNGIDPLPYFYVANVLWDAIKETPSNTISSTNWQSIINLIVMNRKSFFCFNQTINEILSYHPKLVATATAAKSLNKMGYLIDMNDGGFSFASKEEVSKLEAEIDVLCKSIGGKKLFDFIFNNIRKNYDSVLERYHLIRKVETRPDPLNPTVPQLPWGYMIQLAAKYIYAKPSENEKKSEISRLSSLLTNAIALYELQPYSIYEGLFLKPTGLIEFLTETVQYDAIFTINQIRREDSQRIYKGLLSRLENYQLSPDITTEDCIRVCDVLLEISKDYNPVIFHAERISNKLNTTPKKIIDILENYLVHSTPGPNQSMTFPPLSTQIDFGFRPVLKLNSKAYYLPPKSICTSAIIEALQSIFREALKSTGRNFDDELGFIIEDFLKEEFTKCGITAKSGKYNVGTDKEGQCDMIIETETHIILLEIKKKILTRGGRSGNVETLIDLSKSLLDSQIQAMKHEVEITQKGKIELEYLGGSHIIHHNNRKFARISVSLQDFGGLQSGIVIQQFLKICYLCDYIAIDEKYHGQIKEINNKLKKFRVLADNLGKFNSEKQPFFSAWFISIPQILILLNKVSKSEEFYARLSKIKWIHTGTLDFYHDYAIFHKAETLAKVSLSAR